MVHITKSKYRIDHMMSLYLKRLHVSINILNKGEIGN